MTPSLPAGQLQGISELNRCKNIRGARSNFPRERQAGSTVARGVGWTVTSSFHLRKLPLGFEVFSVQKSPQSGSIWLHVGNGTICLEGLALQTRYAPNAIQKIRFGPCRRRAAWWMLGKSLALVSSWGTEFSGPLHTSAIWGRSTYAFPLNRVDAGRLESRWCV